MDLARRYVRKIYNQFEVTLVPSARLAQAVDRLGRARTCVPVDLGVNVEIFQPRAGRCGGDARSLGIAPEQAACCFTSDGWRRKKIRRLCSHAFELLARREPGRYHLLVVGDGLQRAELRGLQERSGNVTWLQYCADRMELARLLSRSRSVRSSGRAGNIRA